MSTNMHTTSTTVDQILDPVFRNHTALGRKLAKQILPVECKLCNAEGLYTDYDEDGYLITDVCPRCQGSGRNLPMN